MQNKSFISFIDKFWKNMELRVIKLSFKSIKSTLGSTWIACLPMLLAWSAEAHADVLIAETFTSGPGCLSNLDADVFTVSGGELSVGTSTIRSGCNTPPGGTEYRHALCGNSVPGDFILDVDVKIAAAQENRAGVVYGWTDAHNYYIFHFNHFTGPPNSVLQMIRFDGVTCGQMLGSPQFDSQRDHWYHVRIEVVGDNHRVFVDGTLRIDVTDPNYAGGQIGLSASFNGYGRFDKFVVQGTQSCPAWVEHARLGPSLRSHTAMIYDSARGVTVLFGGSGGGLKGDTWEWDGCAWTLRSTTGPAPRYDHAMAYDSTRRVAVLFGGIIGPGTHGNDTWEYDGQSWTLRADTGPATRYGHRMAFDSARNKTVLFGGVPNGSNETWEWDGNTWALRSTSGPAGTYAHSMAFDSVRARTVLFGGIGSTGETWEWDGTAWSLRSTSGPVARTNTALVFNSTLGRTLLFGGQAPGGTPPFYNDTWVWDGTSWTELTPAQSPPPRAYHAMAYDVRRGVAVVFGGAVDAGYSASTWEFATCAPLDLDGDTVPDACDNCPTVANANQNNLDGDAFGDVCDQCPYDATNTKVEGQCIPTLSEWGMVAMAGLMVLAGGVVIRRRHKAIVSYERNHARFGNDFF